MGCLAQSKTVEIPVTYEQDTTLWYKWKIEAGDALGLDRLVSSLTPFRFRLWSTISVLDITENDGVLITFVSRCRRKNKSSKQYVKTLSAINKQQAAQAKHIILESGILNLPSEDDISDWQLILDGRTYIIEYSSNQVYFFKTYSNPDGQDGLMEAEIVLKLISELKSLLNIEAINQHFIDSLPNGCYTYDGIQMTKL